MTKSEKAVQYFKAGFNCAQSVLGPFCVKSGISEEHGLKIACAFGAGMGRQQHTCGAVTGALMVLGLHYGKGKNDDNLKKLDTYEKTVAFFKAFTEKHGTTVCLELMDGLHMNDPEEMKKIDQLELHRIRCTRFVTDAVEITRKLIGDED